MSISSHLEPHDHTQAAKLQVWQDAMNTKLQALKDNQTWSVVLLSLGKRATECKWVYKTKFHADGSVERHKGCLVAKGYTQQEGTIIWMFSLL